MTIDNQYISVGFGYAESSSKRRKVIGALMDMNDTLFFHDARKKSELGISSKDLTKYINEKYSLIIQLNKKSINKRYEKGVLSLSDKLKSEKEIDSEYGIELIAVQRILKELKKEGYVEKNKTRYTPSKKLLELTHHSPFHFSEEGLTAIMKLHTPLQNTIKKNLGDLITLFGTYVIACLLEMSRPIPDFFFTNKKLEQPPTIEQKKKFIELCLENIIDTKQMYVYFLHTFLKKSDEEYERNLSSISFSSKRNNRISTGFKANTESFELDNQSFELIRENLSEMNPEITRQLNSVVSWTVGYGEKSNMLYSWVSQDK